MGDRFDVIVVGAGPAGSTAAREMAAAGARVLVVDRAEFPRYKACGGGIPLRTERALPFPIDAVIEDSVHLIDIQHRGDTKFRKDSGTPFAHMVMRDRFDAVLLDQAQHAGADFRPGTAIRGLERNGGVTISAEGFRASAGYLICADGAHSPVGRMAGLGADIAECAAWEIEVRAPQRQREYEARALINVGYRPWGYAWLFPKADLLSIGIVLPREQAGRMKAAVRRYVRSLGLEGADIDIARGHKIRLRRGDERIYGARIVLAGDAAGMADEFTEEGIFYAIQSGRIAARNILRALGDDDDLSRYQRDINAEVMPELRAARLIAHMFYGMLGKTPGAWLRAARFTPFLWNAFFSVQRGESTYARELERVPLLPWLAARSLHD
jgi:geranylgeranyl reductase family protein